jgi:amino acid transporter
MLRRSLSGFDVLCLGLNAIVGSGIFLLPDDLFRELGLWSPAAFLLCALGLWPVARCYGEAASLVTESGGPYQYARSAFGPATGFLVAWMCFTNSLFSFGAVAGAVAASLATWSPWLDGAWGRRLAAAGAILFFAAVNYLGAKPGARVVNLFTIAKFGVLLALMACLFPHAAIDSIAAPPRDLGLDNFARATFVAVFAAQGFEVVPVPAGETREATRFAPLAIVGSLFLASVFYFAVQSALVLANVDLSTVSDTPISDAVLSVANRAAPSALASAFLGSALALGALVSMLGFLSGSAFGTPRYLFAVAEDGELPRLLARVHPRYGSPHVAIVVTGVVAAALAVAFDFRSLLGMSNVAVSVQYAVTCLAVWRARLQRASALSQGALPALLWYSVVPALGCLMSLWIVTEATLQELLWSVVALLLGALIRLGVRGRVAAVFRSE